jgi:hypothetical protein
MRTRSLAMGSPLAFPDARRSDSRMNVLLLIVPILLSCFFPTVAWGGNESASVEFFVSPQGNDAWSGRLPSPNSEDSDGPFATLEVARDAIRRHKEEASFPEEGFTVSVREGTYASEVAFTFDERDSGQPDAPIVYRAFPRENPILSGGRKLRGFKPVTDEATLERLGEKARKHVRCADLQERGITQRAEAGLNGDVRQFALFFNGKPMRLAEWPNQDWTTIAAVPNGQQIVDASGKRRGLMSDRIQYAGDRPQRWQTLRGVWVHGYWMYDWHDTFLKVREIETEAQCIVLEDPEESVFGFKKGQRFRFVNILEELDQPAEWYLDRQSSQIYFWPPSPMESADVTLAVLRKPLVALKDASDIHLIGLTLEYGNNHGITITGGGRVNVVGCELRNLGGAGVLVSGGVQHVVRSCDLHNLGERGIGLVGGDTQTLTEAGHVASNNHIHHFARWKRTYCPGVSIAGVGNRVNHNYIHDAPHAGILLSGNNHVIELNELTRLCLETADVGGFYMGRNWEERGNVIRHNYFHHLGGLHLNSNAVYLDDLASGVQVYGNVFYKVHRGLMLGGGRDNRIENNIFVDAHISIHLDARGLGWSRPLIESRKGGWDMYGRLESVPYNQPPYSTQYPKLANILDDEPLSPKRNLVARNIHVGARWLDMRPVSKNREFDTAWVTFDSNFTEGDPGFIDPRNADFRLRDDSPVWSLGFQRIPLESIGLMKDGFRRNLPDGS